MRKARDVSREFVKGTIVPMMPQDTPPWMKRWDRVGIALTIAILLFILWKTVFP